MLEEGSLARLARPDEHDNRKLAGGSVHDWLQASRDIGFNHCEFSPTCISAIVSQICTERKPVEGIIFWSFSRLARRQIDSQFIKSDLRRRGYVLHSMTDDVPTGDIAPVVEAIIDWKNERYLSDLGRDVKRGLYDLARAGYAPGGFPPRGYKAVKVQIGVKRDGEPHLVSQWVPDLELPPRGRQAFEMRAARASYEEILEATRIFPVRGSYVTMFRKKSYLGIRKCGDLEVEDAHEPLVDRQTWDAVQSTLGRRGGSSDPGQDRPRRETHPFLLTGLARCAECGAAMVGKEDRSGARKTPFRHYICGRKNREGWASCPSGKIPAEGPELAVLKIVAEGVLTPESVRAQTALLDQRAPRRERPLRERIEDAQRRLAGVEKPIAVLLDLAEQYGAESAGNRLVEREAERREVMAELEELEVRQDTEEPIEAQDLDAIGRLARAAGIELSIELLRQGRAAVELDVLEVQDDARNVDLLRAGKTV
jgi:hypothetical protein